MLNPVEAFAAGLARSLVEVAARHGAPPAAGAAVAAVVPLLAEHLAQGHVCLPLTDLTPPADWPARRRDLLASTVVGTDDDPQPHPLVLDSDNRLYLYRHFDYERRLAAACRRLAARRPPIADPAGLRALLDRLFAGNAERLAGRVDWQKLAAALAVRNGLTVISGGPGTGKTTAVVNILACLLADDPGRRVALAAPTGKAAARLKEALHTNAARLPAALQSRLPQEAGTLHALLGVIEGSRRFRHDAANPLPYDVVVVDEASMLDLALATRLVEAIADGARLILLGDQDQLAAVEAGAVFSELSADPSLSPACRADLAHLAGIDADRLETPAPRQGGLADCAVWFRDNFRFAERPGIGRLAQQVNSMQDAEAVRGLLAGEAADVGFVELANDELSEAHLQRLLAGYGDYAGAIRAGAPPETVHRAFAGFRILGALRQSARGVEAVNEAIDRRFRAALGQAAGAGAPDWYAGRPVMVLENDYALRLFNGDIGIALPTSEGGLSVWFQGAGGDCRAIDPVRLPPHETAFAMTVHKSQGSEFAAVALVLPSTAAKVLTRELIYTAVTRASARVDIFGSVAILQDAIRRPTERLSGLAGQLRR